MNTLFNEIHPTAGPKKPQLQLYPCVTHKLSAATQTPLGIAFIDAAWHRLGNGCCQTGAHFRDEDLKLTHSQKK